MSQQILDHVEKSDLKENTPKFEIGDTVDVHTKIMEGTKERIQIPASVGVAFRAGKALKDRLN